MSWRAILSASLVGFLVGGAIGYTLHGKPAPAPSVRAAVQQSRAAHVVTQQAETTYIAKRDTVTRVLARYDTARVTDTVTHDSIVYVRLDVADSTVRACRDVLNSCAALHAADSAEIHALHDEIAARDADRPSRLHTLLVDVSIAGIAYAAGRHNLGSRLAIVLPFGVRF